ncbi:MAG: Outer membrane protein assembly factor BamB [Phycisphaerae bacterium]|nr:Outer membrane protein assembly factor BamB [Phycisphaerae bacterium]
MSLMRWAALIAGTTSVIAVAIAGDPRPGVDWPQFRGIGAAGVGDGSPLPAEWDVSSGKNIAWKTPIPGLAHSSPIVWGERVFVTTAAADSGETELKVGLYGAGDSAADMVEHAFKLYCLDRASGKILWEQTCVKRVPQFKRHTKATHCNSTPATDGRHVVALFGSEGLYCYTVDGKLKWKVDLGPLDVGPHDATELQWGFASSPIIVADRVVVQCDAKQAHFIAAFDVADGRELWRTARDDVPGWATPTAMKAGDGWQVLMNGCKHIGAVDLADGRGIWRMSGGGGIPVPAPVAGDGLIYLTSNHRPIREGDPLKPIFVVRASARGELPLPTEEQPGEHVAWMKTGRGNYMQTPLVYRGIAYFCNDNGALTAYDAASGEQVIRERLGTGKTGFSASAVAGDGKIYFTSEEGDVHVVSAGKTFERVAENHMGEVCMATPAISDGRIIFRTRGSVVCIGTRR